ncbi:pilus assembly protein TadG [Rhizobium sp. R339]|uniref:TadE/TadG family type IV pilus assembly protein n=1 Tax=Rhizobium sp. R339 TaxID=1764273 RepID=UPI000B52DB51|nr:TadE/TadG family type IV pilus assembly protein [Rhizobium sp. R339]OWV66274.1 pilus assembly protein TadG [Rhizobium sp. R339]
MSTSFLRPCLRRMFSDRGGNFGIMTAIMAPVLLGAAGMAIQVGDMLLSKQQLQEAADSAALATATALANGTIQTSEAQAYARNFVAGQMANYLQSGVDIKNATGVDIKTSTSGKSTSYQVTVSPSYDLTVNPLMQAVGFSTQHLATSGTTVSGNSQTQGSVSMFLVLDRSGSMGENTATVNASDPTEGYEYDCSERDRYGNVTKRKTCTGTRPHYYTKIEALKLAVGTLTGELDAVDPDEEYVRTGAVSYNIEMQKAKALDWGTAHVSKYVNNLTATDGTDSGEAFKTAYNKLADAAEDKAHMDKTGQVPTKYIVFMTDGDNNYTSADTETKTWCDKARAAKMQVYTIAFMAPARGQALLSYCATSPGNYFPAGDMTTLLKAFKEIGMKASNQVTRLTN